VKFKATYAKIEKNHKELEQIFGNKKKLEYDDKNAYNQLAGNNSPNYQVISYNPTIQTIDQINQQMPGLRAFLVT
jgi:hypothetical protein